MKIEALASRTRLVIKVLVRAWKRYARLRMSPCCRMVSFDGAAEAAVDRG